MGNGQAQQGDNQGPVGTEYTLQGVMRFLQLEWHNHERARNAWDIERAEMKAKIAKQEGEVRSAKRLNDQLEKHVKMLENALRNERQKSKAQAQGEKPADQDKGKERASPDLKRKPANKSHNSFLDIEPEAHDPPEQEREAQRDKSRQFLTKCVEEITYLLQPPAHPPPTHAQLHSMANSSGFLNHDQGIPLEEAYMQQQHRQKGIPMSLPQQAPIPNHQPPPVPSIADVPNLTHTSQLPQQAPFMTREPPSAQPLPQIPVSAEPQSHIESEPQFSNIAEDEVEKVTHSYDSYGRPLPARESEHGGVQSTVTEDPDGWNFDDTTGPPEPPPDVPPPRRPDTDIFPSANSIPAKSPPRSGPQSHRRKSSGAQSISRRRSQGNEMSDVSAQGAKADPQQFKVRYALRGHLDVVRSVIFTGGGTPSEPEICTAGDDGTIKRWIIPASYAAGQHGSLGTDIDIQSYFTHRGHEGVVTSLTASNASFSTGGRVTGDGWIFSGGQDATVRVWERGRVDPKATLDGHTDAVWAVCVLPSNCGQVFGGGASNFGGPERVLLASGSADGTIKIWAVSAPPQLVSPSAGSRRGVGGSRRHSVTSGSNFPSSPQPSVATSTPFHCTLVHSIERSGVPSPTCITPLSKTGETIVVSYSDASILIFDTRTGEEIIGMASAETYDGTSKTGVNTVVAVPSIEASSSAETGRVSGEEEGGLHGATGTAGGVEGVVISGHEDRFIRFFDANSGQCTYSMLAHPAAISALHLSPDGREAVSAGHDASIRFWSLEKRICTQEISSHRIMRGEGVCSVVWSQDGRLVVSAGGDGVVKVFVRSLIHA
ncbi:1,2-dihydroxy-3-keto-5-methylthiopentene dioxygenase [Diplodia intermedia]|uniref:1,2-dihydroxy-3-keto-5-methylthiopentene dioxygenase n=1 Tax=Diplodia intermedia TaxID=856260 RepID=A0ABR3TKE7_9PEZI